VSADDLAGPAQERGGANDQQTVEELLLLHPPAGEQETELPASCQLRPLPELPLQDQHLLAQRWNLVVATIADQPADDGPVGQLESQE